MSKPFVIHNRVRAARVAREMTQEYLAHAAGVTRQTIGLIEVGRYNPTLTLAFRIARALETPLQELFWTEEVE
jgi:putative transcriptional regulator